MAGCGTGGAPLQIGKWLELKGIDVKAAAKPPAPPPLLLEAAKPSAKDGDKAAQPHVAPWEEIPNGLFEPIKVQVPIVAPPQQPV